MPLNNINLKLLIRAEQSKQNVPTTHKYNVPNVINFLSIFYEYGKMITILSFECSTNNNI